MERRYDLDWLRVLLFALLVPHHAAVGFVDWGSDIYGFTNNQLAGDGMTLFVYWSHSWRLPSLFLIAGIGTWFLTRRGIGGRFMLARLARLLVPALFGLFFLNVFGGYAIALMTNAASGFLLFWWEWLTAPELRQIQHLWFLFSLAAYTLLLWPLYTLPSGVLVQRLPTPLLLALLTAASAAAIAVLKPHAAALTGDNYQFAHYLVLFAGGFLIGSHHEAILDWLRRWAWIMLSAAVLAFLLKATLLTLELIRDIPSGQALASGGWLPLGLEPRHAMLFSITEAVTAWTWCLTALGLAARYLRKPATWLPEMNRAVFPLYVLHFPVTLVGLALVAQISLPWLVEYLLLVAGIYLLTWLLWQCSDRLGALAVLVGGRPHGAASPTSLSPVLDHPHLLGLHEREREPLPERLGSLEKTALTGYSPDAE